MNTYMKKIIIVAVGFCFTSIFGMITQQEQPTLPSCDCVEKGIDSSNELTKDTILACFLISTPKNTQEPVIVTNTIQQSEQNFQQEQHPQKRAYKKKECLKELPNHIIKINNTCYCTLCKKNVTNGSANLHVVSRIHQINQTYGYNVFKIKLNDNSIACCALTCNEHFTDIDDYLAHMLSNHTINNKKCAVCNKEFTYIFNMKRHFYTHLTQVFYTCPGCKATFKQEGLLVTHLKKCTKFNEIFLKNQKELTEQNQRNSNIGSSSSSNLGNNT